MSSTSAKHNPERALSIRPAVKADCALILTLIRELAVYEKLEHEVKATLEGLETTLFGPTSYAQVLLAEWEGEVAGFCLFFHNYSTFLAKPGLYVEDAYVREAFRGHGIGKALFSAAASVARGRGCGRMEWWVLDWNQPAIDFYTKLGATPMSEWTVWRLTGDTLEQL